MRQQHLSKSKNAMPTSGEAIAPPQSQITPHSPHPIEKLQGSIGNRAVNQLLAGEPLVQTKPLFRGLSHELAIQPKLTIGAVGDKYEQEADRVAKQIVSQMNAPENSTIQRKQTPEEDEEVQMKPTVQCLSEGNSMTAAPELEGSIQQAKSGGQPLSNTILQPMEQAFGTDFSGVKIHTDTQSHQLNQSINAQAFTTGQNIFFRQDVYNPNSRQGQELLAHELTHVVQQKAGCITIPYGKGGPIDPDPTIEAETDGIEHNAVQDRPTNLISSDGSQPATAANHLVIQRKLGLEFETGWETFRPRWSKINKLVPDKYKRVNLHKYDDVIKSTMIDNSGKSMWNMSTDEGESASKIEFVLRPFDEINDLTNLKAAMDQIHSLCGVLLGAGTASNQKPFPITNIPNTGDYTRADGFDDVQIEPLTDMKANPQATGGIALDRVYNLFKSLAPHSVVAGTFHSESQKADNTAFLMGKIDTYFQQANPPAWDKLYPGVAPSNEMKGFLALVLHYILFGRTHSGPPKSAKGNFSVLSRTDFASMFDKIAQKTAFQGNPGSLTELILEIWTPNKVTSGQDKLYKNGYDRNGRRAEGPSIEAWLEGITQDNKDIMAFESFGTMGTDRIVKDPAVLNGGNPVKSAASVLELRFVSHGSDYTAWKDIAVKFYYLLRDLNALPSDTDTVQNTRLT